MPEKILPGDRVSIKTAEAEYTGIIMPTAELTPRDILILKLDNGYNIGLNRSKIKSIKKTGKLKLGQFPSVKLKKRKILPTISIISTGGTITSRVDYKTGAVHSLSKPEELLASVPELANIANLKVLNPFNVMGEDMQPSDWQEAAKVIAKELNKSEVKGVVVTHGTDTLHYTSAALSFMLKDLNKPVAIVGGQRSSDRGSFDGAQNLICATHYCLSDIAEVAVVMHKSPEDKTCLAIQGTKVRKMHTSRRDAFRPINKLPLAIIESNGNIKTLNTYNKRNNSKVVADTKFDSRIALIQYTPGLSHDILDFYVKKKYKGIILAGTGLGQLAIQPRNKKSWLPAIKRAIKAGLFVGMTSQCLYGKVNSYVYSAARLINQAGVVYLEDMLPETAYVKLGWVLAHTKNVKDMMLSNLSGEINKRIEKESFLY